MDVRVHMQSMRWKYDLNKGLLFGKCYLGSTEKVCGASDTKPQGEVINTTMPKQCSR